MVLPTTPDRELLLGFWYALGMVTAVLVFSITWVLGVPLPGTLGAGALVAVTFALRAESQTALRVYGIWRRGARAYARRAERLILGACYFVVLLPVRVCSAPSEVEGTRGSSWTRPEPQLSRVADERGRAWLFQLVTVARMRGEPWILLLAPFMLILRWLDRSARQEMTHDTYTLY